MMKKFAIAAVLLFMQAVSYGQGNSVTLINEVDDMTGEVSLTPSRKIVLLNDSKTTGFSLLAYISKDKQLQHIAVKSAGLGTCVDKSELIILLSDGSRIVKKSWNKFNCEGNSYFSLTLEEVELLSLHALVKVRLTNGQNHAQYTGEVISEDALYFVNLLKLLR